MASSSEKVREKCTSTLYLEPTLQRLFKDRVRKKKQLNFDQRLKLEIVLAQVLGGVPREKPGHGDH